MNTPHPVSLHAEHQQLHAQLELAVREPGSLGAAARELARVLRSHAAKEQQYVMPALAALPKLAWGTVSEDMTELLHVTRRLKAELPLMLIEHKEIVAAAARLRATAQELGLREYERFAIQLTMHAKEEEEVLYPAAVLVGDYLAVKLGEPELA